MTVEPNRSGRRHRDRHQRRSGLSERRLKQLLALAAPNLFDDGIALPESLQPFWKSKSAVDDELGGVPRALRGCVDRVERSEPWCCEPAECDHRDGDRSCWERTQFGDWQVQLAGERLDCHQPVSVWCVRCGEVRWMRCRSGSVRDCGSCSHRKLEERKHQISEAVSLWLALGVYVYWVTLTFPGFGGCDARMCDCNSLVAAFFEEHPGATRDDWVAYFNGHASTCFRDWKQGFERLFGVRFEHVRLLEPQMGERKQSGDPTRAYHFHALIVCDRPVVASKRKLSRLANHHGFGHSLDFTPITGDASRVLEVIGYVTRYAKHSVDAIRDAPYVHPSKSFDEWYQLSRFKRRSRCRSITMSRGFSETLRSRRQRYGRLVACRAALDELLTQQGDSGCDGDGAGAAGAGRGAGALESLGAQLHNLDRAVLPEHRLVVAM